MKPKLIQQSSSQQITPMTMPVDPEMALVEVATRDARRTSGGLIQTYDAMVEFQSAASLIFDREECIALEKQLALALQPHPVAA